MKTMLMSLCIFAITVTAVQSAMAQQKETVRQWTLLGPKDHQSVNPDVRVGLENIANLKSIKYGERKFGINLDWDDDNKDRSFSFKREPGSTIKGSLKCGELLAIHVKDHGYLHYKKRDFGINLVWEKNPSYEWQIHRKEGKKDVQTSTAISLHNKFADDYLVFCEREFGINLRWLKDKESKGCHNLWDTGLDLAKKAGKFIID